MLYVPLTSDPSQTLSVTLDGETFTFGIKYNERYAAWTLDITRETDQVVLLTGVPMLLGQDLLSPYALGIGALTLSDLSKQGLDASPDDLGERVVLTYLTEVEKLAVAAIVDAVRSGTAP